MTQEGTRKVVAVLVNYGAFADSVESIMSVLDSEGVQLDVVLVDNASPDGSGEELRSYFADVRRVKVILSDTNRGFGAASNLGMAHAFHCGAEYALLLNNDTHVAPDMVSELVRLSRSNNVVSPIMLYAKSESEVWYGGGCFDSRGIPRHEYQHADVSQLPKTPWSTDWLTGCCLLVTRNAFDATGGFDERFFLYYEDVEWSIRLRRAGFDLVVSPSARMWHKVSASTGGEGSPMSYYYGLRNRLVTIDKLGMSKVWWIWSRIDVIHGMLRQRTSRIAKQAWGDYRSKRLGKADLS